MPLGRGGKSPGFGRVRASPIDSRRAQAIPRSRANAGPEPRRTGLSPRATASFEPTGSRNAGISSAIACSRAFRFGCALREESVVREHCFPCKNCGKCHPVFRRGLCPKCFRQNPPDARTCEACGAALPAPPARLCDRLRRTRIARRKRIRSSTREAAGQRASRRCGTIGIREIREYAKGTALMKMRGDPWHLM